MKKLVFKVISTLLVFALLVSGGVISFAVQTPTDIPQGESKFIKPVTSLTEAPEGYIAIRTAAELDAIRNNLGGNYILMNDIELAEFGNWEPIGDSRNAFVGIFNGNGYTINNLTINSSEEGDMLLGLFALVNSGIIINLGLENVKLTRNNPLSENTYVGGIAVLLRSGVIANCFATGEISIISAGNIYIGGLVSCSTSGMLTNPSVYNCYNGTGITATSQNDSIFDIGAEDFYVGGIIGFADGKAIISQNCNSGEIHVDSQECLIGTGGILGVSAESDIIDCLNLGDITVTSAKEIKLGGIAGCCRRVSSSCNIGNAEITNVIGTSNIGGIVGEIAYLQDENSGYLTDCYYSDKFALAASNIEGKAANNVKPLTADTMKKQSMYEGFDFDNVWAMSSSGMPQISIKTTQLKSSVLIRIDRPVNIAKSGKTQIIKSSISDEGILTIDNNGNVTAVAEGTATVDFITSDGQYGCCEFKVTDSFLRWLIELIFDWLKNLSL